MLDAHTDNPRLDLGGHLMRTRQRPRTVIGQAGQPVGGIATQPGVHTLAGHPKPAGHVGHRPPSSTSRTAS